MSKLKAPTYHHVARLVFRGDLRKTYEVGDKLIHQGLVRQITNPYDRRERCLALTQAGARAMSLPPSSATVTRRILRESVREGDVYVDLVEAGIPEHDVLPRPEVATHMRFPSRNNLPSWAVHRDGRFVFLYVRHPWSNLDSLNWSLSQASAKVIAHVIVCLSEPTFRRLLDIFMDKDLPVRVTMLGWREIYGFGQALLRQSFSDVAERFLTVLSPGGALVPSPEGEPFPCRWEHPRRGVMRLIDARFGDLTAFRQLGYSSDHGLATTVFVQCREQAERIASMYRYHESLWVVVCGKAPQEALFRVRPGALIPLNGGDEA